MRLVQKPQGSGSGRVAPSIILSVMTVGLGILLLSGMTTAAAADNPPGWHLLETSIDGIHDALKSGKTSCHEVVQLYLNRIDAYDKKGPGLNAIQNVNPKALEEADRLDQAYKKSGFVGPLHCIPVVLKDEIETSDMPTTYGSELFKDFIPNRDATVVTKVKAAGAIVLGKTTMGEYALSYIGSAFGISRNAYAPDRNPSGSSGGTGAALAANFATVAIAEDTGGSIRGPAAVSSLVGLRPSVPLVSRFGLMPWTPTMDTLGPMARNVRDAAILLDVIAGYDPKDQMTAYNVGRIPKSYTAFLVKDGLKGARIGVIREPMDGKTKTNSEDYKKVRAVVDAAIVEIKGLGAEVMDPVTIPDLRGWLRRTAWLFGIKSPETEQAIDRYLSEHPNTPADSLRYITMSDKVAVPRRATLLATIGRTTDEPAYLQAMQACEQLRQTVLKVMADNKLDALIFPVFDHQPAKIPADVMTHPDLGLAVGSNRALSSAVQFPSLAVPIGFTSDNLPVGIEIMGRPFEEGLLFKLAYSYEQGTHHRRPPATTPALPGEP